MYKKRISLGKHYAAKVITESLNTQNRKYDTQKGRFDENDTDDNDGNHIILILITKTNKQTHKSFN